MNAYNEAEEILRNFEKKFLNQKSISIVIYGIGKNTKFLLENLKGYNIIGLMDPIKTGSQVFGLPVLSKEEAKEKARVIVIVARRSAIRIIYNRIKELEGDELEIINLLGVDLKNNDSIKKEIQGNYYWKNDKNELIDAINKYDVISFDVFDTLISRLVINAESVFGIVEGILKRKKILENFQSIRKEAQIEAINLFKEPTYTEIYMCFSKIANVKKSLADYIMQLEFEIELKCTYSRDDMIEVIKYAIEMNKDVYLISDMYFSAEQIRELLKKSGFNLELPILVSNEYRSSKETGELFAIYKNLIGDKKCLHIGDNYLVDIVNAKKNNIDGYYLKSSYDLAMESGLFTILKNSHLIDNSVVIGLLVAKLFPSPFSLSETRGVVQVKSGYIFGYFFCGTMILAFFSFLFDIIASDLESIILFGARDGYLIERIYKLIIEKLRLENMPLGVYFLTSRRAATIASCNSLNDIEKILKNSSMQCSQDELLRIKFGVKSHEDQHKDRMVSTTSDYEELKEYVLKYFNEIIDNAQFERDNYKKYVNKTVCLEHKKVWFYDFVTSGTIVSALNAFLNRKIDLICFATTGETLVDCQSDFEIRSYLGKRSLNVPDSKFIEYYLLWECILTSSDPQLEKFDENGEPVFLSETEKNNFSEIQEIQKGIEDFVSDFLEIKGELPELDFDRSLNEELLNLLKSDLVEIDISLKHSFKNENYYENIQMDNIWDLVI